MNYLERIKNVQMSIIGAEKDALLLEHPIDIFYLTGLQLSRGSLLVHLKGAQLFVDNRYIETCRESSPVPVLQSECVSLSQFLKQPENAFIKNLAFDSEHTSYQEFLDLRKSLSTGAPQIELSSLSCPLVPLRMIKDDEEIARLRTVAQLGADGFDYLVNSCLHEGVSEAELALELDIFWKRRGSQGMAFEPIIAFGAHSSRPHYQVDDYALKNGMTVLIDIGVTYQHYHSDMTRTLFFGEPDPQIREIYSIVKKAQELALELCRPGIAIGEVDQAARGYIQQMGYETYFKHGLGHGIGLEVHEAPFLRNKPPYQEMLLAEGMVITVEPGIYLPNQGGVRIEDTIVINAQGHENLTQRSHELFIKD
jgi:Xaa-Pro aminopeptidase